MNSEDSTQNDPLKADLKLQDPSLSPSLPDLNSEWNDAPLEALIDQRVDELGAEDLAAFVKRCATLRSSAQSRRAALKGTGTKKPKGPPKQSNVDKAMELLKQMVEQQGAK